MTPKPTIQALRISPSQVELESPLEREAPLILTHDRRDGTSRRSSPRRGPDKKRDGAGDHEDGPGGDETDSDVRVAHARVLELAPPPAALAGDSVARRVRIGALDRVQIVLRAARAREESGADAQRDEAGDAR